MEDKLKNTGEEEKYFRNFRGKIDFSQLPELVTEGNYIDSLNTSLSSPVVNRRHQKFVSEKQTQVISLMSTNSPLFSQSKTDNLPSPTLDPVKIVSKPPVPLETDEFEINLNDEIPSLMWCAYCRAEKTTKIQYINSSKTFLASVALFFSGGFLGCCLIPYAMNQCKSSRKVCTTCEHVLG